MACTSSTPSKVGYFCTYQLSRRTKNLLAWLRFVPSDAAGGDHPDSAHQRRHLQVDGGLEQGDQEGARDLWGHPWSVPACICVVKSSKGGYLCFCSPWLCFCLHFFHSGFIVNRLLVPYLGQVQACFSFCVRGGGLSTAFWPE